MDFNGPMDHQVKSKKKRKDEQIFGSCLRVSKIKYERWYQIFLVHLEWSAKAWEKSLEEMDIKGRIECLDHCSFKSGTNIYIIYIYIRWLNFTLVINFDREQDREFMLILNDKDKFVCIIYFRSFQVFW